MHHRRRLLAVPLAIAPVVAAGLLAAAAQGTSSADPPFAKRYVGTVTGTFKLRGRTDTWNVSGLTFTLQNARYVRGAWGGTYRVVGGRVAYTSKETAGGCSYATSGSFPLGRLSWMAAAISFLQDRRSSGYSYLGRVSKGRVLTVVEKCGAGSNAYTEKDEVSPAGGQWWLTDIDERLVPGKALRGSYTDRSEYGATTWKWNLAPRR